MQPVAGVTATLFRLQDTSPCNPAEKFRSPHVLCLSGRPSPANVLRAFSATPLTIPAPGRKIAASRCPPLIPSGCRVGGDAASLLRTP